MCLAQFKERKYLMEKQQRNNEDYYTIDLLHIVKMLWKHGWFIALCGLVAAAIGFIYSAFMIAPTYSSYIKLYVNNSSISLGNTSFSISQSELTAAQSLIRTYGDILESRSTLERIIDRADLDYSWKQLAAMITYEASNETEIMRVTVTGEDPYEASEIANTIAEVLPVRIAEIIDGATMEVVDSAIPDLDKIAPSVSRYTGMGLAIGILLSVVLIAILAILDDTIHDEDYIIRTYDYPILGKVPNLLNTGSKSYRYYSQNNYRIRE